MYFFPFLKIFSATFVVTSNADSGPGTLREAITLANNNGIAETDFIHFNISDVSETGRTITLLSSLPNLTSNIVIDGSTQPGPVFGVSESKIHITCNDLSYLEHCITIEESDNIEIYGTHFSNFRFGTFASAFYLIGTIENLKIGAPGKGNVFTKCPAFKNRYEIPSALNEKVINAEFKSNFFGLNPDGETVDITTGVIIMIQSFKNMLIGGDTPAEGNYFSNATEYIVMLRSDSNNNNGFLKIKNNQYGSNYSKTKAMRCGTLRIDAESRSGYATINADLVIDIYNNSFNHPVYAFSSGCHSMVSIWNIAGFITVKGNSVGNLGNYMTSCQTNGIALANCTDGIIGGPNPEDQNYISENYNFGISLINNRYIKIEKNSIFCNAKGIRATSTKVEIPTVKILSTNDEDYVAGIATPNAKVELFENKSSCSACTNGHTFIGETTADNNGNWTFTKPFSSGITARATSTQNVSGAFSEAEFTPPIIMKDPVCGQNNGAISGTKFISGTKYYWVKKTAIQPFDTIYNKLDLDNLSPGTYEFVVEQTKYCTKNYTVYLQDKSPKIHSTNVVTNPSSCGKPNGAIYGLIPTGNYTKIFWLSKNRDTISIGSSSLSNITTGDYKLIVLNEVYGCGDSTDYFHIPNLTGPTLNQDNINVQPATCDKNNGSINGIVINSVTGQLYVEWRNAQNILVSNDLYLTNQPAGKYWLSYRDQSNCDPIKIEFEIAGMGSITINELNKNINPAGCTVANGSITGLTISGANSWYWTRIEDNTIVSNELEVQSQPAGTYQLTATNTLGCEKKSSIFTISKANVANITVTTPSVTDAYCNQNNGSVKINGFSNNAAISTYEWVNNNNNPVGNSLSINNLSDGVYRLNVTDTNGCKETIYTATINKTPVPVISTTNLKTINDVCEQGTGSITGLNVIGLLGPTSYTWYNENNIITGNSLNLVNVPAGTYKLEVKDKELCTIYTSPIIVVNTNNGEAAPRYDDMVIQRNTPATLKVKNIRAGTYTLYSDALGTQMLDRNETGIFQTTNLSIDQIYYIQYNKGVCSSPLTPVKITVVDKSYFAIATGFTPNGDGHNEKLNLKVIGYINVDFFQIYNRNGEMVFSTKTIEDGWDGRWKGIEQPTGAYVWVARGRDLQGNIITDKGSFVLIR